MFSFEYLYSLLGDNQHADKIEKLAYNGRRQVDPGCPHAKLQSSTPRNFDGRHVSAPVPSAGRSATLPLTDPYVVCRAINLGQDMWIQTSSRPMA